MDEQARIFFQRVRDRYVTQLVDVFAKLRAERSEKVYTEAALRTADGDIALDGPSQLGLRVDAILPSSGESIHVNSESMNPSDPLQFEWDGVNVSVHPFYWDQCVITLKRSGTAMNWSVVVEWFRHWFDTDDVKPADEKGLYQVVHFLSDQTLADEEISFTVDLGSAPVEALESLLSVCVASKPVTLRVSHS